MAVLPPLIGSGISPTEMSMNDGARRFSNSEIQTFKRCRRKWWLSYYRQLQPRRKPHVGPLPIGNRVHRALQYHYQSRIPESLEWINALDALEVLIMHDREILINDPEFNDDVEDQFNKEADLQRIMLEGYLQWLDETGDDGKYEIIGAEVYSEADITLDDPIRMVPIKIIARLDLRVRRLSDGLVLFLDHKTTASFPQLIRQLRINEQMLFYMLIGYLYDEYTAGALYNMIRRVKRSVKAKPPFYARESVYHNHIELDAFHQRTKGTIHDIMLLEHRLNEGENHRFVAYPTPTPNCDWDCPFVLPCKMMDDGSHAEDMLKHVFTMGDPLSYYVSDELSADT